MSESLPESTHIPEDVVSYFENVGSHEHGDHSLKYVTKAIEDNKPLSVEDVSSFVARDLGRRAQAGTIAKTAVSIGLIGATWQSKTYAALHGGDIPDILPLWPIVDAELRSLYETLQLEFDIHAATLGDHLPAISFIGAAAAVGVFGLHEFAQVFSPRSWRNRFQNAQQLAESRLQDGTMTWSIQKGSTVAFVGSGDPLATTIAQAKPGDIMQLASNPVPGQWVHLPNDPTTLQIQTAYDHANIANAGELLFLPTRPGREFLPGSDDFEYTVNEIEYLIKTADEDAKIGPKNALIIASKQQFLHQHFEYNHSSHQPEPHVTTLEQSMKRLEQKRGRAIHIIDPDEVLGNRIVELAGGRPLTCFATGEHASERQKRFFEIFRSATLGRQGNDQAVRVLSGNDVSTVMNVDRPDDIAVITDAAKKKDIENRGLDPERILVISEELFKVAAPLLHEQQT